MKYIIVLTLLISACSHQKVLHFIPENSEGEPALIKSAAPYYPPHLITHGVEGYVVLEYTIDKNGNTQDVQVFEEQPEGVFSESAIAAAKKFKYKPGVKDGEAIDWPNWKSLIRFTLPDTSAEFHEADCSNIKTEALLGKNTCKQL